MRTATSMLVAIVACAGCTPAQAPSPEISSEPPPASARSEPRRETWSPRPLPDTPVEPSETERPATEEAAVPSGERLRQGLAVRFESEAIDTSWRSSSEAGLRDAFDADRFPATRLHAVECRATMCRLVVVHDAATDREAFIAAVSGDDLFRHEVFLYYPDEERPQTELWVARENHSLTRAPA
jgi:hypothetical protein